MNEPNSESVPARERADDRAPMSTVLRDPEIWLFRHIPLHYMIALLLFAATAAWVATAFAAPALVIAIVAVFALAAGAAPVRRRHPHNLVGMIARAAAYRGRRARPDRLATSDETVDVPLTEGGSYGVRWEGGLLITMMRIDPPPDALTLLRRGEVSTDQVLPLTEIGKCLSQFDIRLASIDVISTGARTASNGVVARLYDSIIGPLPAIAHLTVWLVLRLDPLANARAIDNRGGEATGTLRTAIIATRRVANRLAVRDISTSVLTASEMNAAMRVLTRGVALEGFEETPRSLVHDGVHLTSYAIGPELVGSRGFADIWATPSLNTTVTVRLRPDRRRGADLPGGMPSITLAALARFDTEAEPAGPPVAGLRALPGQQFRALLDTLPIRSSGHDEAGDYCGPLDALDGIALPTAGCGQLIGADRLGQGIAVPLIGEGTRHLEVIGKLDLAQQVLLRAIALGAHVVVHTYRPENWHSMVVNVGDPYALSLAPRFAGGQVPAAPAAATPGPTPTTTVIVFDGVAPTAQTGGATIVHVRAPNAPAIEPAADVVLIQDPAAPNSITVRTSSADTTVTMVTTPDEMRYIGESLVAAR